MASVGMSICSVRNIDAYFWDRFLKLVLGLCRFPHSAGYASVNYNFICYEKNKKKKTKTKTRCELISL